MEKRIGRMESGPRNTITDVPGVRVGHCTIDNDRHKTGVTVILPCENDIFQEKMVAACHVLNGFGKTAGLMQIQELGTLETPIALTNTLNVGLVHDAMAQHPGRGRSVRFRLLQGRFRYHEPDQGVRDLQARPQAPRRQGRTPHPQP